MLLFPHATREQLHASDVDLVWSGSSENRDLKFSRLTKSFFFLGQPEKFLEMRNARPGRPSQTSFHLGPRSRLARADSWTPGRDGGCRSRLAHLCCARTWAPLRYGLLRLGTAQDKSRLWRAIIVSHYRLQHYYSFLLHQPRNLLAISTSQCLDTELKFHCEGDGQ
jgi:hypothetical protein